MEACCVILRTALEQNDHKILISNIKGGILLYFWKEEVNVMLHDSFHQSVMSHCGQVSSTEMSQITAVKLIQRIL